jgi:hypothetical protein
MSIIIPNAEVEGIKTGYSGRCHLTLFIPEVYREELGAFAKRAVMRKRDTGIVHLTLGSPWHPKSTGYRSRLNLLYGWAECVATQLAEVDGIEYTKEDVVAAWKRMATSEGWPSVMNPIDGREEPMGIRWASEEQMTIICNVAQLYVDTHGMWVVEYVDGEPRRCLGGVPIDTSSKSD